MKILKIEFVALITIMFLLSAPAGALENGVKMAGTSVYPCDLSPAEVIAELTSQRMNSDPDTSIIFKVTSAIMKDSNKLIKSVEGLPGNLQTPPSHGLTNATVTIPFAVADFRKDGSFDSMAFNSHVSHQLDKLQVPDTVTDLNCGGSPLGTTITEIYGNCSPTKVTTEYEGEVDPVSGNLNWMVKSSSLLPTEQTVCDRHITKR